MSSGPVTWWWGVVGGVSDQHSDYSEGNGIKSTDYLYSKNKTYVFFLFVLLTTTNFFILFFEREHGHGRSTPNKIFKTQE